jgi:hypothetical protein
MRPVGSVVQDNVVYFFDAFDASKPQPIAQSRANPRNAF